MPSVRMGIGIDPHANRLCRLFGFSGIYPIGFHFGSWYISRIIYSILISTEYRKLAALVNLQLWKEKNCKYVNLPSSYYGQILLLILGKSNISYYNYSVSFFLYWSSASVKKNVPWHILAPGAVACDMIHKIRNHSLGFITKEGFL